MDYQGGQQPAAWLFSFWAAVRPRDSRVPCLSHGQLWRHSHAQATAHENSFMINIPDRNGEEGPVLLCAAVMKAAAGAEADRAVSTPRRGCGPSAQKVSAAPDKSAGKTANANSLGQVTA